MIDFYIQLPNYSPEVCACCAEIFWTHRLQRNVYLLLPDGGVTASLNSDDNLMKAAEDLDSQLQKCLSTDFSSEEERKIAFLQLVLEAINYSCLFSTVSSLAIDEGENESRQSP